MFRPAVPAISAVLLLSLTGCSSENVEACEAYESAQQALNAVVDSTTASQQEARDAFAQLPDDLAEAAAMAEGEVAAVMQQSADYAAAYQESQTEDNGMAFFLHQNDVVEACGDDGVDISVE